MSRLQTTECVLGAPARLVAMATGLCAALTLTLAFALLLPSGAMGAFPETDPTVPQKWCPTGAGGGQCTFPRGIAADPRNGHVFVAEQTNRRISEFDPLGKFVKTWGWDVVASGPGESGTGFEICVPADGDVCKAGTNSGGAGQLNAPQGVAVDSSGNVYVGDLLNNRVQKFDPDGNFVLTFGGDVNKTKVDEAAPEGERNLCTAASGNVCQQGAKGPAGGRFLWPVSPGDLIAIDTAGTPDVTDDKVYVGDVGRIQRFDSHGQFVEVLPEDPAGELKESTVRSLAVDGSGSLYAIYSGKLDVRKITPGGEELEAPRFELPTLDGGKPNFPTAVAADGAGHVFAFGSVCFVCSGSSTQTDPIFEFDSAGVVVNSFGKDEFDGSTGLAVNLCAESEAPGNLYATNASSADSFIRAYGTEPVGCFKARTGEADEIGEFTATLNATVNPAGLPVASCAFEYGTTDSYGQSAPCEPAAGELGEGEVPVPVAAAISGLQKGTVYHFRIDAGSLGAGADVTFKTLGPPLIGESLTEAVARSEATVRAMVNPEGFPTTYRIEYGPLSGEGFPLETAEIPVGSDRQEHTVREVLEGLAPGQGYRWRIVATNKSGAAEGEVHLLATYRTPDPAEPCPNEALRSGSSAALPDCRAYEMVSPIDKNGGDIANGRLSVEPAGIVQAASDGNRIAYTAVPSFGDQASNFVFNSYIAERGATSWQSNGLGVPYGGEGNESGLRVLSGFTPELCSLWVWDPQRPPISAEGQPQRNNLYRRDNCGAGAGALEALVPSGQVVLPEATPGNYVSNQSVQGFSEDGAHALFVANAKLSADASAVTDGLGPIAQLYDRFAGAPPAIVSVLPTGVASDQTSALGSGWNFNLEGAVSEDGSRVYWTTPIDADGTGKLYVRSHPEQGIVAGECTEAAKPCTTAVSAGADAFFWQGAADGSAALYSEGGDLYRFELATETSELLAEEVVGVSGASADLDRVYFVSRAAIAESGQNSEGDEATEGDPNLYLADGGARSFVATLAEADIEVAGVLTGRYHAASRRWPHRATRVSAAGERIVFQSRAPLTGFDNRDAASGEPAVEVFTYAAGGDLACVSCNPGGARPQSRPLAPPYSPSRGKQIAGPAAAAWIPTWEHPLDPSNAISADGGRIFFHSNDALLPRDANATQDVYEWESPGVGGCDEGDAEYFEANGGCLYLISTGQSTFESEFWEAGPDGRDVFFTTRAGLVPQDPGLIDLYDARAGGGLPAPSEPVACEGEACQSPPPPPEFGAPASATFLGTGNPPPAARSCRPAARRAARLARQAKRARRAARRAARPAARRRLARRAKAKAKAARRHSRNAKRCRRAGRRGANR